jgi:hypothetical protein
LKRKYSEEWGLKTNREKREDDDMVGGNCLM